MLAEPPSTCRPCNSATSGSAFTRLGGFPNLRAPGPRVPARVDSPDASEGWDRDAVVKKLAALAPDKADEPSGRDQTEPTIGPVR